MRTSKNLIVLLQFAVLPTLLGLAGCFTDVNPTPEHDGSPSLVDTQKQDDLVPVVVEVGRDAEREGTSAPSDVGRDVTPPVDIASQFPPEAGNDVPLPADTRPEVGTPDVTTEPDSPLMPGPDAPPDLGRDSLTDKGICTPAAKQCSGLQPQTCDTNGFWQNTGTPCQYICSDTTGTCTGACSPAQKRCNILQPQSCDSTGTWQDSGSACLSVCDNATGSCTGSCKPNSKQCSSQQPQTCDASGGWQNTGTACPYVCDNPTGTCTGSCKPNAKQCTGQQPQTCDATGAWQNTGAACPFVCELTTGNCTGSCKPGAKQCVGLQPQVCDGTGTWQNTGTACAYVCDNPTGSCAGSCTPTSKQCSGQQPQICDAAGTWQNSGTACSGCMICGTTTGLCVANNGVACDDGNACTQTDACQAGTCVGSNPKTCTALDQCHNAGVCDTASGICSNPTKPVSFSCNDGNSCTDGDACNAAGACVGTAKACNTPTQCHVSPGTCSGGTCSYPTAASNGSVDYTCPGGTQFCYNGTCVQCTADAQCSGSTPSCDPSTHRCVCRRPSAGNLLKNPGFDGSLANWTPNPTAVFSSIDSDGCPGSGSVYVENGENDPNQCIPVTAGKLYRLGLRSRGGVSGGFVRINMFAGVNCTGTLIDNYDGLRFIDPSDSTIWLSFDNYSFTPPAGTVSARVNFFSMIQWIDQVYVNPDGPWF